MKLNTGQTGATVPAPAMESIDRQTAITVPGNPRHRTFALLLTYRTEAAVLDLRRDLKRLGRVHGLRCVHAAEVTTGDAMQPLLGCPEPEARP